MASLRKESIPLREKEYTLVWKIKAVFKKLWNYSKILKGWTADNVIETPSIVLSQTDAFRHTVQETQEKTEEGSGMSAGLSK